MSDTVNETDVTALPAPVRWSRALAALRRLLADPTRTNDALEFTTYANAGRMLEASERLAATPAGRRLLAHQPAIDATTVDITALAALPEGTLGRAYAAFLTRHRLSPEAFAGPPAGLANHPRASYMVQRLRQTHDLWHVVTGYEPDPAGEIALQAFSYAETDAPSAAILAGLGTLRALLEPATTPEFRAVRRALPREVARAYWIGRVARSKVRETIATYPWEDRWATPLAEVRAELGLPREPAHRLPPLPLAG